MQKKFLSMVIALVMLISLLPQGIITVSASTITATPPSTDENSVYQIGTAAELYWFAGLVNGTLEGVTRNLSANAILTKNIVVNTGVLKADGTLADDTSGFTSWTPIGNSAYNYTGTFNGNGKTISGLYFNDTNAYNVGLFGCVGSNETNKGSVSNVGVVDSYFGGHMEVGGVCGTAGDNSTITNCYNAGSVAASGNSASAGGVCGRNSNGNITNCYFDSEKYSGNAVANDENGTVTNVGGKTTDKFTSGEVAYLLQGKQTENVWGQEIDTDNYPVLTSDLAKKVCKVEFDTRNADGEYTLYTERYGNYGKVLSDFPEELTDTIWVGGGHQFTASSTVTEDKTVYSVGYSVKYDDDGKVVISAPKMGNYKIIIASYSGESLLRAKSADIQINNWYESYEITALYGFDITGADTVKVFFWDTEMRPQCDIAVKTLP